MSLACRCSGTVPPRRLGLMGDIVSPEMRSRMMAGIRGKNTKPEVQIRSLLHRRGFRFRLHAKELPGHPDIVLPKWNAAIFVHGCFWHGHDCHLFRLPQTRHQWWKEKIERNRAVDIKTIELLRCSGWRVLSVFECALKGKQRLPVPELSQKIVGWILSTSAQREIRGDNTRRANAG